MRAEREDKDRHEFYLALQVSGCLTLSFDRLCHASTMGRRRMFIGIVEKVIGIEFRQVEIVVVEESRYALFEPDVLVGGHVIEFRMVSI